eukprot:TRINITY_DN3767_c0_g1_i2.p1 TRINITY_DN3767_c0_g1~~TRINITY_DN3767_c0_g1_i2.p1  ORF type:complete len:440 (-),score=96.22 TRINITY_DN3767_c0_g1_i2:2-1321(-)
MELDLENRYPICKICHETMMDQYCLKCNPQIKNGSNGLNRFNDTRRLTTYKRKMIRRQEFLDKHSDYFELETDMRILIILNEKELYKEISKEEMILKLKFLWNRETKTRKRNTREYLSESIEKHSSEDSPIDWIDIQNVDEELMMEISTILNIHPLTVEDCTNDDPTREKHELFEDYLFVVLKEETNVMNKDERVQHNINLLIFSSFIITLHTKPVSSITSVIFNIGETNKKFLSPDWVMYCFLDVLTDSALERTNAINNEVNNIQSIISAFEVQERDTLKRIDIALKKLSSIRILIKGKKNFVGGLVLETKHDKRYISNITTKIYLRDVNDHIDFAIDSLKENEYILRQIRDSYLTALSLKLSDESTEMNNIMKRFTAVSTIMLPLTLIAGIFGMNIKVPFVGSETRHDNLHAFWIMMALMTAGSIFLLVIFKIKKWV